MSRSVTDLQLPIKERCVALVDDARNYLKRQIIVISTLRTWPEQAKIYAQGRSLPGPIVTKARPGFSWHNFGLAFDVAFLTGGKITWSGPWQELGALGEKRGLVWGGRFPKPDEDHFEYHYVLRDGAETKVTLAELRLEYEDLLARRGGEQEIQWHS